MSATTPIRPRPATQFEALLARDRWSREQLLAFQHERLRELIEHAATASPFYREALGPDALAPDVRIEDLPILTKATLMDQFDRVVTDPRLRLDGIDTHITGPDPGALLGGRYHVFTTSGTAGRRGVFPQTQAEFGRWLDVAGRNIHRAGLESTLRVIGIAAPTPLHLTQKLFGALGGFGSGRPALTATTPLPELVRALNADGPTAMFTIPSLAGRLAAEQLDRRLAIDLRKVVVAGEVLSDEVAARLEAAWGVRPLQIYGTTEALMLASESRERVGLHISEDIVMLEVVDEDNRPVPPGIPGYKVLLTSLIGRTVPLIRYELADSVTLAAGPDPSGRPYRRIERIDGRDDDQLTLPARGGGEVVVLPHQLRAALGVLPGVVQYQIVQEPQRLVIRLVLAPGAGGEPEQRALAGVNAALQHAGAVAPPLAVEVVGEIEREPGGAKLKLVKSM
jgi:phenylacetate-CoA ligase